MAAASAAGADLAALSASFRRTLRAQNKSDRTVEAYTDAVRLLAEFCAANGHPLTVSALTREHVELFIADQLARWKPATANNRYRGLQSFFGWAVAEGELEASLMAGMRPPQIPETPVPVLTEDQLRRLLKACDGRDFIARRDTAIIRLLIDTGLRRGECAGIMLDDLDLDDQVVIVLGKGRRPRALAYGRKTALALDRYLRVRAGHPHAGLPNLWIGRNGAMTPSGIFQVVSASWLAAGGTEGDLMRLAGWKSRSMVDRYAKATAEQRARASRCTTGRAGSMPSTATVSRVVASSPSSRRLAGAGTAPSGMPPASVTIERSGPACRGRRGCGRRPRRRRVLW